MCVKYFFKFFLFIFVRLRRQCDSAVCGGYSFYFYFFLRALPRTARLRLSFVYGGLSAERGACEKWLGWACAREPASESLPGAERPAWALGLCIAPLLALALAPA